MKKFFKVMGSAEEPYIVKFSDETGEFKASCTCPAGIHRTLCKHIIGCLENDDEIKTCFASYGYDKELFKINEKIIEAERLKKEVSNMKKALAKIILK